MIDPLATIIADLTADGDLRALTAGRVAGRHAFSMADTPAGERGGWPTPARALTLTYAASGVPADTATCGGMHMLRLEARCYGADQPDAARVWLALDAYCHAFQRRPVTLIDGTRALLFYVWPDGGPAANRDPDTRVDYLSLTVLAGVARDALPEA